MLRWTLLLGAMFTAPAYAQDACVPETITLDIEIPTGRCAAQAMPPPAGQAFVPPGYAPIPYFGQPVPNAPAPQTEYVPTDVPGLWIAGLAVFGAAWLLDIAVSMTLSDGLGSAHSDASFIPIAGPWLQLALGEAHWAAEPLLVIDGIAQAAGALLFILGVSIRRDVPVQSWSISAAPTRDGVAAAFTTTF